MEKDANAMQELAAEAKWAILHLKALQKMFMAKMKTYDQVLEEGKPLIATYNKYAKALAKARKMPYKPISLGYFLR